MEVFLFILENREVACMEFNELGGIISYTILSAW